MGIPKPVHQDLSKWPNSSDDQEQNEIWDVGVPESTSLYWSVLLSYLISSAYGPGNFERTLERVTGDSAEISNSPSKLDVKYKELDLKRIQKTVKQLNPFKNANIFKDVNLTTLMQIFKVRLNRRFGILKGKENAMRDDDIKIQAASNILQCNINVYEDGTNGKILSTFSPKEKIAHISEIFSVILFRHTINTEKSYYGMGLKEQFADWKRTIALKYILKNANVSSNQIALIKELKPSNKFLFTLLDNSLNDAVLTLYESPYALKKLANAGYDMNPLSLGPDEFSSFYKCICSNDLTLFFVLYNHVAKRNPLTMEEDPNPEEILKRLSIFMKIIKNDCHKSGNFSENNQALHMFEQIIRFNQYHYEITKAIILSKQNTELTERDHNMMTVLLKKYNEYFYFDEQNTIEPSKQLMDYTLYYDYHKILDEYTYLCFFDHFLHLKIKCNDNVRLINNTLVSLFEYFISKRIFGKSFGYNDNDKETMLFIPFSYRMELQKTLKDFNEELQNSRSERQTKFIKDIIGNFLQNNPTIKEEFLITRLKRYLEIGEKVSFDRNPIKAALVIERALQVIGETIKSSNEKGCILISLLRYSIPADLVSELCNIRNHILSHFRASSIQGRLHLEKDGLLEQIQKELHEISIVFEAIFGLQTLRVKEDMMKYIMQNSNGFIKRFRGKFDKINKEITQIRKNLCQRNISVYICLVNKIMNTISEFLNDKEIGTYDTLQRKCQCIIFLLTFIANYYNECDSISFESEFEKINELLKKLESERSKNSLINEVIHSFSKCREKLSAFINIKNYSHEMYLPNLKMLCGKFKYHDFFNDVEKKYIRKSFEEFLSDRKISVDQLLSHANKKIVLTPNQIEHCIKTIVVTEKTGTEIKKNINTPNSVLQCLNDVEMTVEELLGNDQNLCYKFMNILMDVKFWNVIEDLCLPRRLHRKIFELSNVKLNFVKDRMNLLKQVLVEDDDFISNMMKYYTSPEGKSHAKQTMVHRYVDESDTSAALEMLLFDCLNIFIKRKDFRYLWEKMSGLMTGANLRHLLSHGSPVFDTIIDHLDEKNLPTEVIDTILTLIEDQKPLEGLIELWEKTNCSSIEELRSIILSNDCYPDLKNKILKSGDVWQNYLLLLPRK